MMSHGRHGEHDEDDDDEGFCTYLLVESEGRRRRRTVGKEGAEMLQGYLMHGQVSRYKDDIEENPRRKTIHERIDFALPFYVGAGRSLFALKIVP